MADPARKDPRARGTPAGQVFRRFRRHRPAFVSLVVLALIAIACFGYPFFAGVVVHSTYTQQAGADVIVNQAPSAQHWMGTDSLGRDQFLRILKGGQVSLLVGLAVAVIGTVIGTAVGVLAGYRGGFAEAGVVVVIDFFLSLPFIALMLAASQFTPALAGGSILSVVVVLSFFSWMILARIVRAETLSLREKEFMLAARAAGASNTRIVVRHVLPNEVGVIIVNATLAVAVAILAESTLSFLGFGVKSEVPTWGNMLNKATDDISLHGHLFWAPALCIVATVLAVNFMGDGLRDAFDPKSVRARP